MGALREWSIGRVEHRVGGALGGMGVLGGVGALRGLSIGRVGGGEHWEGWSIGRGGRIGKVGVLGGVEHWEEMNAPSISSITTFLITFTLGRENIGRGGVYSIGVGRY